MGSYFYNPMLLKQRTICGISFIYIPSGIASIGAINGDPLVRNNEMSLTRIKMYAFWISKYPITQGQYIQVMSTNPSYHKNGSTLSHLWTKKFPIDSVSWHDAIHFCNCLNSLCKLANERIRLPYECEWEYACRGSSYYVFQSGNTFDSTQGNIQGSYPYNTNIIGPTLNRTCEVGLYAPNAFGLYDMHGNVWEWCMDEYKSPSGVLYPNARVLKGGAWNCYSRFCRTSYRAVNQADKHYFDTGFRVVICREKK